MSLSERVEELPGSYRTLVVVFGVCIGGLAPILSRDDIHGLIDTGLSDDLPCHRAAPLAIARALGAASESLSEVLAPDELHRLADLNLLYGQRTDELHRRGYTLREMVDQIIADHEREQRDGAA